ncbi:MAG: alpha-galactosidase [Spirochaetaceae bacterium]
MSISYDSIKKQFHLHTKETSYLMEIINDKHLAHAYWGKRVHSENIDRLVDLYAVSSFSPLPDSGRKDISFDTIPREFPDYGRSDYESPAIEITTDLSSHIIEPNYHSHKIVKGKPEIEGLPSTYLNQDDSTDTLIIKLEDKLLNLVIKLYYSVSEEYNVITRHVVVENIGKQSVVLNKIMSSNVDFIQDSNFELINLFGSWTGERQVSRIPVGRSGHIVDSKRGSSSHEQNPFIAISRPETTDFNGEVYSMNLVYSGSFSSEVSVNAYGKTRMMMGINPIDFEWNLETGKRFTSPEAVLVYSDKGLNGMSSLYHRLYRERLCRGTWQYKERPILINNWEATYFNFNEDKIKNLIDESCKLGLELFVLDDGWFGKRDSDTCSLGDWFVHKEKLPGGLETLSDYAHKKGMMFGLWFEPEMISPISELYEAHEDWCLHIKNRSRSESRDQLILDLGREDVRDYLFESISKILKSTQIDYVKWDMNRNMTEVGSAILPANRQKETTHRYILGLYELMEKITSSFPNILFESCSGGGGRFDPGMLHYMPQTWTSDNSDSYDRLKIQWGTSYVYPPISMGSHVSEIPNHQVQRNTPFHTRGNVAMSANLGYELDITKSSQEDKQLVKEQIEVYKSIRHTVQFGDFYRLQSPYKADSTAWMIVSTDKKQVVVYYFNHLAKYHITVGKLKLTELDPEAEYVLDSGQKMYGDALMHFGLRIPEMKGDFDSAMIILNRS